MRVPVVLQMGYTPLHMACLAENAATLHILLTKLADVNMKGPSGFTGMHFLAQSETAIPCIEVLLKHGASLTLFDEVCKRVWVGWRWQVYPGNRVCPVALLFVLDRRSEQRLILPVNVVRSVFSSDCTPPSPRRAS